MSSIKPFFSGIPQWPIDKLATLFVNVLCVYVYLYVERTINKQPGISCFLFVSQGNFVLV